MFLWVRLPSSYDTTVLLPQVVARDVAYVPGAPFYAGEPDRSTLRLCFVTQTPQEIGEGLRRLGEGLRGGRPGYEPCQPKGETAGEVQKVTVGP